MDLLPQTVKLPITFFEKCIPINFQRFWGNFSANKNEAVITGDPIEVFGNSKTALEKLAIDSGNEATNGFSSAMLANPKAVVFGLSLESR
jgi:hypothetical protein